MTGERRLRLLVGKVGLDGHDRGAKIIARAFRDAGFEVIYTGLHQTPEMVVQTAIQEDVDAVSLSILSGAHNYLFPRVIELLRERGAMDIAVFGGGIVPDEDVPGLKKAGVLEIFTPGASTEDVIAWVRSNVKPRVLR
ncbi:MAG TPA: cobalamin B12-binding domain-containing protein [Candidatus Polarisedimenticolaceae bacterium]|nr:cobalamin B12-binding domain-containing protein [Candidatus Polarisedimenticolaceae bacterium]